MTFHEVIDVGKDVSTEDGVIVEEKSIQNSKEKVILVDHMTSLLSIFNVFEIYYFD